MVDEHRIVDENGPVAKLRREVVRDDRVYPESPPQKSELGGVRQAVRPQVGPDSSDTGRKVTRFFTAHGQEYRVLRIRVGPSMDEFALDRAIRQRAAVPPEPVEEHAHLILHDRERYLTPSYGLGESWNLNGVSVVQWSSALTRHRTVTSTQEQPSGQHLSL